MPVEFWKERIALKLFQDFRQVDSVTHSTVERFLVYIQANRKKETIMHTLNIKHKK